MELDLLPTFVAFADHLNFTRAARDLHLSQPAVHMQVKKLEESIGVALYRRVGRRLVLTREGEALARFARDTATRARGFLAELRGARAEPVVLSAGEGAFLYLLGPAIRAFARDAPLRLLTRDRDGTLEALRSGVADLGVAALEGAPDGLVATKLTTVDPVVVMPRKHLLAKKKRLRPSDLTGERLVVPPLDRPQRTTIAQTLRRARVEWEVAVEAVGWEVTIHFVALGLGVAIVNGFCRLPAGVCARPLVEMPGVEYHLVHRPGALDRTGVGVLRAALLEHAKDWRSAPESAWSRR